MARRRPKILHLSNLFLLYLEPLDVIDSFHGTHMFDAAGVHIRTLQHRDDITRRERVNMFMETLERECENEGNIFQHVVDVLKSVEEYKWLVQFLEDGEPEPDFFICLQKLHKPAKVKDILQHLMNDLKVIHVEEVVEYMRKYLSESEREEINKEYQPNENALFHLLHVLIHKKPGWVQHLIQAIKELGYNATREIPDVESGKLSITSFPLWEILNDYFGCFNEDGEMNMPVEDEPVIGFSCSCAVVENDTVEAENYSAPRPPIFNKKSAYQCEPVASTSTSTKEELYNYQKELSKPALAGENVVICAPTNSGKTTVAAHIIEKHFETGPSNGKVIFFTPTVGLANQQFEKLKRHLHDSKATVTLLHGYMEDNFDIDPKKVIYSHDVIVMTPQILLNCLEAKHVQSVLDFTMFIFDECHHARTGHQYSKILHICANHTPDVQSVNMSVDTSSKLSVSMNTLSTNEQRKKSVQIIGLTATLGIGAAVDDKQAKDNIFELLATLHASGGLSLVRENEDELNEKCPAVGEKHLFVEHNEDLFKKTIKNAVRSVLSALQQINACNELHIMNPPGSELKLDKKFFSWCQRLRRAAEGHLDSKTSSNYGKSITLGRDAKSCADTLLHLIKVYELCLNCHPSDATEKIEDFTTERFADHNEKNTDLENSIHKILEKTGQEMQGCVESAQNEMLKLLENELMEKYKEDAEFRCMIMVKRRLYADRLENWINTREILSDLRSKMYIGVGSNNSRDTHGMSHRMQAQAIESFKKGECRLLVCTADAAGEGIDVPDCNLVITVECVHDEIKKVQLTGRARKENSEVVHIHFGKSDERKDFLPANKVKMMKRVTRQIDRLYYKEPDQYKKQLLNGSRSARAKLMQLERKNNYAMPKIVGRQSSLLCRGCSAFICSTGLLIKVIGEQHTVNDKSFKEKYARYHYQNYGNPICATGMTHMNRIRCAECKCDWGTEVVWKEILIPILTFKGFKIKDVRGGIHIHRKWKDTRLQIPKVDVDSIEDVFENAPSLEADLLE